MPTGAISWITARSARTIGFGPRPRVGPRQRSFQLEIYPGLPVSQPLPMKKTPMPTMSDVAKR